MCASWWVNHRLSGELQARLLRELYRLWALWRNFVQPVMRLECKTRVGSKLHRRYDVPATPYPRLLDSGTLSGPAHRQLQNQYDSINPVALMKQIQQRQTELLRHLRNSNEPKYRRTTRPHSVTSLMTQRVAVR